MENRYIIYGLMYLGFAIALFIIGNYGYWKNPKRFENKMFFGLTVVTTVWAIGDSGFWFVGDKFLMLAFYHFKYVGIILTAPFFFLYILSSPIRRLILNKKWFPIAIFIIPAINIIMMLTNPLHYRFFKFYQEEDPFLYPGKIWGKGASLWWLNLVYSYILLVLGLGIAILSVKQAKTKIEKDLVKFMFLGTLVPFVGNIIYTTLNLSGPDLTTILFCVGVICYGFAVTRYKLMVLEVKLEEKIEITKPVTIEKGLNYIYLGNSPLPTYNVLRQLASETPALCITGNAPVKLRANFDLKRIPIVWLTEIQTKEQALSAERIDFEVTQMAIDFFRQNPGGTVLFDNAEYISGRFGFDKTTDFLKTVSEVAKATKSTFIVPANPTFFSEEEQKQISSIFDKNLMVSDQKIASKIRRSHLWYTTVHNETLYRDLALQCPDKNILIISKMYPDKIKNFFGESAKYYWSTPLETTIQKVNPGSIDVDFIVAIKEFRNSGGKYIVLDGLALTLQSVGFQRFLGFVKDITDICARDRLNLYCIIHADTLNTKEKVAIEQRFDISEERAVPMPEHAKIEPGYNYCYLSDYGLQIAELVAENKCLLLTGKYPPSIKINYAFQNVETLWLTDIETEEKCGSPERLDIEGIQTINTFWANYPEGIVIIDDVEYLCEILTFEKIAEYLKELADKSSMNKGTLIVHIAPSAFSPRASSIMQTIFDRQIRTELELGPPKVTRTWLSYSEMNENFATQIRSRLGSEPLLIISKSNVTELKKLFGTNANIYKITDELSGEYNTISQNSIETDFFVVIKEYIRSAGKTILIDGLDVIYKEVDYKMFIRFIKDITDIANRDNINLICLMKKDSVSEKHRVMIEQRFDMIE